MRKIKLNSYRLLLLLICGFLANIQYSWANELVLPRSAASIIVVTTNLQPSTSELSASDSTDNSSSDDENDDEAIVMIAGQYSVGDDFESFGKPPSIEC